VVGGGVGDAGAPIGVTTGDGDETAEDIESGLHAGRQTSASRNPTVICFLIPMKDTLLA
jgi:hypothetical protein